MQKRLARLPDMGPPWQPISGRPAESSKQTIDGWFDAKGAFFHFRFGAAESNLYIQVTTCVIVGGPASGSPYRPVGYY